MDGRAFDAGARGTHGSGRRHGVMATQIEALRLVCADGSVRELSKSSDPVLFDQARVSLGSLGVLSEVTLRCVPAYRLKVTAQPIHIDQAIEQAVAMADSSEFSKVWWLPHTDHAVLFTADRSEAPREPAPITDWLDENVNNPLVFADTDEVISGGNFHAEPIAFAADILAFAATEIGSISERRTAMLCDPSLNGGLPAFLVTQGGLNSGFMIAQVTAAALVSECKMMAHPASVDTIPTSANQEDHVSMATHGARRSLTLAGNVAQVVGIEAMAACQGLELHRPLRSTEAVEAVFEDVRGRVAFVDQDRYLQPDLLAMRDWVRDGDKPDSVLALLPSQA